MNISDGFDVIQKFVTLNIFNNPPEASGQLDKIDLDFDEQLHISFRTPDLHFYDPDNDPLSYWAQCHDGTEWTELLYLCYSWIEFDQVRAVIRGLVVKN